MADFSFVNEKGRETGMKESSHPLHGGDPVVRGHEGTAPDKLKGIMTRSNGCPFIHGSYSQTVGQSGPCVLNDVELRDKIQHFDREQTPPRNVHALGHGAYGSLTITNDISQYCGAKLFQTVGTKVPMFARFSGVFTERGESELVRDLRGLAWKFYTAEGNWDILCVNTPNFNVRDMKVGPDGVHAFKRDPRNYEWNDTQVWDFVNYHPEGLAQTLMIYTDEVGTPQSYRTMNGWAVNTFSFINDKKVRIWVRYHFISKQGVHGFTEEESKLLAGEDPNWLSRDLREAIERGDYPEWKFCFQWMAEEEGYKYPWTFDATKAWPIDKYPLVEIGTIRVDKFINDYFAETEQVAFSPGNVLPGIDFSPDRLLQGRLLVYDDTQFHRLGPNFKQIPINRPRLVEPNTVYIYGQHQHEVRNKWPHYYPSEFSRLVPYEDTAEGAKYTLPPMRVDLPGPPASGYYPPPLEGTDADYYEPIRALIREISQTQYNSLVNNLACSLAYVADVVALKTIAHISKASADFGAAVQTRRSDIMTGKIELSKQSRFWHMMRTKLQSRKVE